MKTRNFILTLAIGVGIFAFSNVNAIDPITFSTDKAVSKSEMIIEKDIKVQDWMIEADRLTARNGVSKEKSLKAMHQAMEEGRTAAWFDNTLVGDADYLAPLVEQSLEIVDPGDGFVPQVQIHNHSDADFILENLSDYRFHNQPKICVVKAHQKTTIAVKTVEELDSFKLRFRVLNAFTSPDTHPEITLRVE